MTFYLVSGFIAVICFTICGVASKKYGDEVAGKYCWPLAFIGLFMVVANLVTYIESLTKR